jgi:hypothetical protein
MAAYLKFNYTGGFPTQTDPSLSLGGLGSNSVLNTTALANLFDSVRWAETTDANYIDYRAIDIKNMGDATARSIQFYITPTPNTESMLESWYEAADGQSIGNEEVEPVGAVWSTYLVGSKLSLDSLETDDYHRIWLKRTVTKHAESLAEDTATLHIWYS